MYTYDMAYNIYNIWFLILHVKYEKIVNKCKAIGYKYNLASTYVTYYVKPN